MHGLDLSFGDGLNVLIGPRGSGKTSIIELIRFCLGISAYSNEIENTARRFALAILGSGQVTVTVDDGESQTVFTRAFSEEKPRGARLIPPPTVLSQGEIETIGLEADGRLRLIDSFSDVPSDLGVREKSLLTEARSMTTQMQAISNDIQSIEEEAESLSDVPDSLKAAEEAQEEIMGSVEELANQQSSLTELSDHSTALSVRADVLQRSETTLEDWMQRLRMVTQDFPKVETWPTAALGEDLLEPIRANLEKLQRSLARGESSLQKEIDQIAEISAENEAKRLEIEQQARDIRTRIDEIEEGAGKAARDVAELKEKVGKISAMEALIEERRSSFGNIQKSRSKLLSDLDKVREARFAERQRISEEISSELRPSIDIRPVRSAQYSEYESAISEALRGSGLKYNLLAPRIAKSMSPREFSEAVELGDADRIAEIVDIPLARATKVVAGAQASGIDNVLTCRVEDGIDLMLLTGGEYKQTEQLSTGQRCTVILPILLSRLGRTLIVDQPEDNLDNAFIVDTVIKSIRTATSKRQIICATHNPNIPVLGEANQVILLESDGRRGFVANSAPLEDPDSVTAITSVMEGGREAFLLRAEFYSGAFPQQ